MTNTSCCCYSL